MIFLPETSFDSPISASDWNPLATGPGHTAVIVTPVPFSSLLTASLNDAASLDKGGLAGRS